MEAIRQAIHLLEFRAVAAVQRIQHQVRLHIQAEAIPRTVAEVQIREAAQVVVEADHPEVQAEVEEDNFYGIKKTVINV